MVVQSLRTFRLASTLLCLRVTGLRRSFLNDFADREGASEVVNAASPPRETVKDTPDLMQLSE